MVHVGHGGGYSAREKGDGASTAEGPIAIPEIHAIPRDQVELAVPVEVSKQRGAALIEAASSV